jgi:dienelactone hydrolase
MCPGGKKARPRDRAGAGEPSHVKESFSYSSAERVTFDSGGRAIGVTCFEAPAQPRAAIIVLHGAGGIRSSRGYPLQLAVALAEAGFATYAVHYFDRTNTVSAYGSMLRQSFPLWLETVKHAVDWVSQRSAVDATRIGTLGVSLGGYLVVAHALKDPRIRAVVEFAGGIEIEATPMSQRLPPLLILHGEQDEQVPVSKGRELEALARRVGTRVETEYYPDERHVLSPRGALRALSRAIEFFHRHLD